MAPTPPTKTCNDCGLTKPQSEFYKHPMMADGHLGSCKSCRRAYARHQRINNPDVQRRDNERSKTAERQAHIRANAKRWRQKHPDRYRAQTAVGNALRDGKLVKKPCARCGSIKYVHAHHDDYAKPLKVKWLCAKHHHRLHGGRK